ncbi:Retrovirus-related Pol polyprotein from transposon RE1, partial [Linum grandiflorum]
VNIFSQYVHDPKPAHVEVAARVVRYLKSASGQVLFLPSDSNLQLHASCDVNLGGCRQTRRSTTRLLISLSAALVSWRTKKQQVVSRSSAEAEYRAMATTVSEVFWLRFLLSDLGVPQSGGTILSYDSQAALHIAIIPVFHERTKHVEMDCYFVRERVTS